MGQDNNALIFSVLFTSFICNFSKNLKSKYGELKKSSDHIMIEETSRRIRRDSNPYKQSFLESQKGG